MSEARLLLDTNILVSGLLWQGNEQRLVDGVLTGHTTGLTTKFILTELERVLRRLNMNSEQVKRAVTMIETEFELVEVTRKGVIQAIPLLSAPHDAPVLAATIASKAILVTGDRRLRRDSAKAGVQVRTTIEALALLSR